MPTPYDAIVIGTGQAGPSLAARLAESGRRTAVIERGRFGGTCVNRGCIPTKTLVASARAMHVARRGGEFGFTTGGDVLVDMPRVKARMDEMVERSSQGIERWMTTTPNITTYRGHGRFVDAHTVSVGDEVLEAAQIFVNVGARPAVPTMHGVDTVPFLTSSTLLDLPTLPEHLIVVGGSYIGLEFAQMYRRFGSHVTVIERGDRLLDREDEDVSTLLHEVLTAEGIDIRLNASCIGLQKTDGGVAVDVACADGAPAVRGTHVLLAVGRQPNTDDLGLAAAGIEADARGFIPVDDGCRTAVPGVWALGDCNGHGGFTHTAYHDYEVVAANLLDDDRRGISDRITCYALFTDPPVARVGMTMREARASGRQVLVGERPMQKVSRAREMGEPRGFMRVLVDADTGLLLGAVVAGVGGDEVVHSLLDVMYARSPYTTISRAVHIHPTVSELIPTMLQELTPLE